MVSAEGLFPSYLFCSSAPFFSVRPSLGPLPFCSINEGVGLGRLTLSPLLIEVTFCPFSYTVHVVSYRFSFSSSLSEM